MVRSPDAEDGGGAFLHSRPSPANSNAIIYMYVYTHIRTYTYTCMYTYTYIYLTYTLHLFGDVWLHTHNICLHIYMYVFMYVCIYLNYILHLFGDVWLHTHNIYVHMYVCIYIKRPQEFYFFEREGQPRMQTALAYAALLVMPGCELSQNLFFLSDQSLNKFPYSRCIGFNLSACAGQRLQVEHTMIQLLCF
jgi:hypothetical protein